MGRSGGVKLPALRAQLDLVASIARVIEGLEARLEELRFSEREDEKAALRAKLRHAERGYRLERAKVNPLLDLEHARKPESQPNKGRNHDWRRSWDSGGYESEDEE